MERLEKLKGLLKENPKDSFLRHAMALEYIKLGDEATARTIFEELLKDEPEYVGSYYHLAKLLERNELTEEAIKVYERGIEEAKKAGDDLSSRELRAALEELTF